MVRYAAGSVLFVGQDPDGTARNATRRATAPSDPVQKRDLRGSDKSYPPVLPGDPARVWIVEGGINALASQDYFIRRDQEPPTVIVSGGANVRSWLDNPDIQQTLRVADRVTIAGEIEKSVEVQERTDAGHQKQADKIQTVTNGDVYKWSPPSDKGKDIADVNRFELTQMQEKERTQKQEQSLQNNNGHGMDMGMS